MCIPTLGRNPARLKNAVESVRRQAPSRAVKVVVIDNSPDSVVSADLADEVVATGVNLGFVGALEYVFRHYPADFLWSVQDDMVLLGDCLGPMLEMAKENPRAGAISPVQDWNGVQPARARAGFWDPSYPADFPWKAFPDVDTPLDQLDVNHNFLYVFSSGTLYRSEALTQIGGMNLALFPLGHVDIDLGVRLTSFGRTSMICKDARIHHEKGGSTPNALGHVLSELNRVEILRGPTNPHVDDLLGLGYWRPMVARMSHLVVELGERLEASEQALDSTTSELARVKRSLDWRIGAPRRFLDGLLRTVLQRASRRKS